MSRFSICFLGVKAVKRLVIRPCRQAHVAQLRNNVVILVAAVYLDFTEFSALKSMC